MRDLKSSGRPFAGWSKAGSGTDTQQKPRVALFVTCLVDLFRPNVGFSAVALLEEAGCSVDVPPAQVCCGQPAYNGGDAKSAADIARQVIETFEGYDFVVGPSGSCMATIRIDYPKMFDGDSDWQKRANELAERSYELMSFLTDIAGATFAAPPFPAKVTYHDSCSGLRSLGIKEQPRTLLASAEGLSIVEMQDAETCCGFGGTFCVKYSDISNAIVSKKTENIETSGADLLLAGDLGCLMNMAGKLHRNGSPVLVYHAAEVLAGMADAPSISARSSDKG